MKEICMMVAQTKDGRSLDYVYGDAEIPAGKDSITIDAGEFIPKGVLGVWIVDIGSGTLPYSYTLPSPTTIEIHAPPFVIDASGKVVPRGFTAKIKYLAVGKP
jgi:hypothetical protein